MSSETPNSNVALGSYYLKNSHVNADVLRNTQHSFLWFFCTANMHKMRLWHARDIEILTTFSKSVQYFMEKHFIETTTTKICIFTFENEMVF